LAVIACSGLLGFIKATRRSKRSQLHA
jgi:hypothetical protein